VENLLRAHRFRFGNERELQDGIAQVLSAANISFAREVVLGDAGVIDFVVREQEAIGLEVKISGSLAALTRQLHRYAQRPELASLMLVTPLARLIRLPPTFAGKPLRVVHLLSSAL